VDRIYLMHNGKIVDEGTYDALMKRKSKFFLKLLNKQDEK